MTDIAKLPESTAAVAYGLLTESPVETRDTIAWARDLWATGLEHDDVVSLALLEPNEWQEAASLLPKAIALIGLDQPALRNAVLERDIVSRFIAGNLDEAGLIDAGFHLWYQIQNSDRSGRDNPFQLYDDLGLEFSTEFDFQSLNKAPSGLARRWLVKRLIAAGAFERTRITPPDA